MNVYAEAVKEGGDYWNNYMPEKLGDAHALSRITPELRDNWVMYMAEKYKDGPRHLFQVAIDWRAAC